MSATKSDVDDTKTNLASLGKRVARLRPRFFGD